MINSPDFEELKEEMSRQLSRYESLRQHNAKLLYKLLCARGNIQVILSINK